MKRNRRTYIFLILAIVSSIFLIGGVVGTIQSIVVLSNLDNIKGDSLINVKFRLKTNSNRTDYYIIEGYSQSLKRKLEYTFHNYNLYIEIENDFKKNGFIYVNIMNGKKVFLELNLEKLKANYIRKLIRGILFMIPFFVFVLLDYRNAKHIKKYYYQLLLKRKQ